MSTILIAPNGDREVVPDALVPDRLAVGYRVETAGDQASTAIKGQVESDISVLESTGQAAGRTITLGGTDALQRAAGGEDARRHLVAAQEAHPLGDTIGTIGGAVLPFLASAGAATPVMAAGRLGSRIASTAEGASVGSKLGRAALGYGIEGSIVGAGQGVTELALSDDPLTLERIASTLSSNALYGGAVGAGAGTIAKAAEIGIGRARTAIQDFRAGREALDTLDDDLTRMDPKQLKAARDAEVGQIKLAQKADEEAQAAVRAKDRAAFADELNAFRRELKESDIALTTKDIKLAATEGKWSTGEIGKVAMKADGQIDRLLNNPIALAKDPHTTRQALNALQQQENVYLKLLERGDELRAAYGADTLGLKRAAALDAVPAALEKNRALQARIEALNAPIKSAVPDASPRLQKIDEAREVLSTVGRGERSIAEQMLAGSAFSGAAGLASAIPFIGPMAAPFIGAKAAKLVSSQVFSRLGKAGSEAAMRGAAAVDKVLDVSARAARMAPPIATRVLNSVRYAPAKADAPKRLGMAEAFKARSEEIRSQTMYGPDGKVEVRPEARQAIADQLLPIRAVDPIGADRLETIAARRLQFLASKLPRRPDSSGFQFGGKDLWRPSDFEMRTFARYAAAVEDPHGVMERVAAGMVTPEDAETMREVYPELLADFTAEVSARIPELRKALPYKRRLAMSILSGVPVDPAMDPGIMAVLQKSFAQEPGTESGTQAPRPQPQFGSVRSESPTPAQERAS